MRSDFTGKVVWITGASSGIGEALAHNLAARGARLVLSSRNAEQLRQVALQLPIKPQDYLILPLDLERYNNLHSLPGQVIDKFGQIDILINNGGISQRSYFKDTSLQVFKKIMDVNFLGTVALTKVVLPHMVARKSGSVIAVSSVTGKYGTPLRTAYSASKHALHGFFDALRAENYQHNLHVMLVCPGYVKTRISFNALLGDGSPQNCMDPGQESGLSPETCARAIVKGIASQKREIYTGGLKEVGGVYIKRFFPGLFARLVKNVNVR